MCVFLNTLPKKSKTAGTTKKKNLVISIRPCPDTATEKTWYQFRLLNFQSKTTDRDHPFIQRYVHQVWKKNEKGYNQIENEVICPVTKWVPWDGDRYDCPICKFVNALYNTLKETNWKDADAKNKKNTFSRKFQAILPVYVVNDPNYNGNNDKFKVLIFNDLKFYKALYERIEKQLLKGNCFNGVNASDICFHMTVVPKTVNEGKPNQYIWHDRVIDTIAFSKPYDLPAITKEAVDAFPYDETYYTPSTKAEIEDFYNKYIKVAGPVFMEDDDDVQVYSAPTESISQQKTVLVNEAVKLENPTLESDDLSEDIDNLPVDEQCLESIDAPKTTSTTDVSIDSIIDADALLNGLPGMQ